MMQLSRYRISDGVYLPIDTLELNTTYWLKMVINGTKCRFYISTNGTEYTFKVEDKDNTNYSAVGNLNDYMYFGSNSQNSSSYWRGTIDFNGCYIKQDDTVLWNGIVGETPIASTDTGWTAPVVEELDTVGLVAHWDFENTFKDEINNIEINENNRGLLASDESYRGSYSYKPSDTSSSKSYQTDISTAGLDFDSDWSVSFQMHSDYFGKEGYDDYYYTSEFALESWDADGASSVQTIASFSLSNGGYNSLTFNGLIVADLNTSTIKSLLHEGWNKFAVTYDASEARFSIYVNNTLVASQTSVYRPDWSGYDFNNINYMRIYSYNTSYQQYFDDICLYNKVIYEYTGDTYQLDTNGLVAYWDFAQNPITGKSNLTDSIANIDLTGSNVATTSYGNYNVGCLYTYDATTYHDISTLNLSSANSFSIEYDIDTCYVDYMGVGRNPDAEFSSRVSLLDSNSDEVLGTYTSKWGMQGGYIYTGSEGTLKTATTAKDKWNKITLTYNATSKTVNMYINDELIDTITKDTDFTVGQLQFNLGYASVDWIANYGVIDNLKIYNRDIKEQQS